jgi:uncharacterized OsmC-like protein
MQLDSEKIDRALKRNTEALRLKPSIGQNTGRTTVKLEDGLSCEIEEGPWKLKCGMSEASGGENLGPDPGMFGRGALGSCLVLGYAMEAAKRGIAVNAIEIEVEADYDASGFYGLSEVRPGYLEVRYCVTIESDAPEEDILAMLDAADAHSPWVDVYRRPQIMHRSVTINPGPVDA